MESSGDSMVKELAEASQTTFIRDKWVYTDYSNEMQYSIVAPCLPGSGNYSNYNLWGKHCSNYCFFFLLAFQNIYSSES